MIPMPINTGDGEQLSRSNVLLKILRLSNFLFHVLQCTLVLPADYTNLQLPYLKAKWQENISFSATGYFEM